MSKFKVNLMGRNSNVEKVIGTYDTIEDAAEHGWDFAHGNGYTRSECENHDSVVEALVTRQYCMLNYGPNSVEVEEVMA